MEKRTIFITSTLLVFLIFNTGCISYPVSDWEYEHYYYVEIKAFFKHNFSVIVPLPSAADVQQPYLEMKYFNYYIDNLIIIEGNCTYNAIEHNSDWYLQLNGSTSIIIFSSFVLWDSFANISLEKKDPHDTFIYSDSSNISLVVDSRAVRKTEEEKTYDFFYSTAMNLNMEFPVPSKTTWKNHLLEEKFLDPTIGWQLYPIKEAIDWRGIQIE